MRKSYCFVMGLTILVSLALPLGLIAGEDQGRGALGIPQSADSFAEPVGFSSPGFCEISIDGGVPKDQYANFDSGMGIAVYMDPAECGAGDPYPFQVEGARFYLYEPLSAGYLWPVDIQVNVRDVSGGDKCNGPDTILSSETFSIPSDSAYPLMMNLTFSEPCCVSGPFFLEVVYLTDADGSTLPSLVTDLSLAAGADTCDNWFLDTGGYHGWVEFWGSSDIGDAIIRATGYVDSWACQGSWYWVADTIVAPSGTPDFDQYQFGDSAALCGPAAVANCLWWFDAVPEGTSAPELVRLLSGYFGTHPDSGTRVDSIESGLNRYFEDYGLLFDASVVSRPDFYETADLLRDNRRIVLLLGFWQLDLDWERVGGHFVSLAGISADSTKVALSDPARDAAADGWQGRVRPLDYFSQSFSDTLHNDPEYVSHDAYWLLVESHSGGDWRLVEYHNYRQIESFEGMNFQPGQEQYAVSYDSIKPTYTEPEYAILIFPRVSGVEDEIQSSLPKDFELLQNHPNPFNAATAIRYRLSRSAHVMLDVYNILGQKVATLVDENQDAGSMEVTWDGKDQQGRDLASGVYFYELRAGDMRQTKRMVLLK